MADIQSYKDLTVWQKAMEVARTCYSVTNKLPKSEQYSLASQIRRSAVSIPSNIAEGHKRGTRKDYAQFLRIAAGSAAELETQLILVSDVHSIRTDAPRHILNEVQRMLTTLIRKLG